MTPNFEKHPIFTKAQDIADICSPLQYLNVHNFCYIHINQKNERTWLATNPKFTQHYLDKKYYKSDVHNAKIKPEKYMLYNQLDYRGKTRNLIDDASDFGLKQFFMISQQNENGTDYYHFSTQLSRDMSQIYLSHIPELNQFIDYFHDKLNKSRALQLMSQFKIKMGLLHDNCKTSENPLVDLISYQNALDKKAFLKNSLSMQQIKCLDYLSQGYSAKKTAIELSISHRTVESYLDIIRQKLNFKNKYELIAWYCKNKN